MCRLCDGEFPPGFERLTQSQPTDGNIYLLNADKTAVEAEVVGGVASVNGVAVELANYIGWKPRTS
jgi:hypothetical protein